LQSDGKAFNLFYYVQVIVKFFKYELDVEIMDKILENDANIINYLSENKENVLFKVKKIFLESTF
jgi:hypothetical protein